jgi:hypothetical protein
MWCVDTELACLGVSVFVVIAECDWVCVALLGGQLQLQLCPYCQGVLATCHTHSGRKPCTWCAKGAARPSLEAGKVCLVVPWQRFWRMPAVACQQQLSDALYEVKGAFARCLFAQYLLEARAVYSCMWPCVHACFLWLVCHVLVGLPYCHAACADIVPSSLQHNCHVSSRQPHQ